MERTGILLIDKPAGITSHDVVARLRKILGQKSIGHSGTLDPMATGLMVMLLGKATKLSNFILTQNKTYETTVKLGVETDSWDITGEVLNEIQVDLPKEKLEEAIEKFTGNLELSIPMVSAKKVNGKKLLDYAREGKEIEVPKKPMKFYDVNALNISSDEIQVSLSCSKGSFIRSWGHELGASLGVGGTLTSLRRTFSAPFSVKAALTLEQVEAKVTEAGSACEADFGSAFVTPAEALPNMKVLMADAKECKLLKNGQIPHSLAQRLTFERKQAVKNKEEIPIRIVRAGDLSLLALISARPAAGLKILRVVG